MGLFKKIKTAAQPKTAQPKIENVCINRLAPKCKEWKNDAIIISSSRLCAVCGAHNGKVYSLYGWSKKYPKMPDFLLQNNNCPECNKNIGASMKFE